MIHEVDEAIRLLLVEGGVPGGGGELAFEAPTKDWTARRNTPTVNVFLYDIREDLTRRRTGTIEEYDEAGMIVGWHDPPRWYHLSYLLTAWTNRPADEHRLLADVLSCLARTDTLEQRWLTGTLAELGLGVSVETAGPVSEGRAATDIWTALGGELKPAVDLKVTAPLAGQRTEAGPPVTEGVVLEATTPGMAADGRHLRYENTAAQGTGFAAPRQRPEAPARRKRRAIGP
ncbi:DUF4255 domain-containing protein [Actinocrispum wychmicini]|uniref:Uncharacterized protein DUF4255 n=1 Tax=Actinocrispum wychmicini TaxID=1213861 RepID=A0A4R2J8Z0_9PSEU|nr:DUF4255 domain-containing protein [Actinocrispum wychmicini]TCO55781.1 uncharacterized protein DUF4255 [Actinocrispum wychmicini]